MASGSEGASRRTAVHWVYLSSTYFLLAGAVFYLYLARILPPDELGAVVVLQAIGTVVSAAVALGLGSGVQHFLSFHRAGIVPGAVRTLMGGALAAAALLGLLAFLLVVGISVPLADLLFPSQSFVPWIELDGVFAGLLVSGNILKGTVLGLQRFAEYSSRAIVTYTLTYGGASLFVTVWPAVPSILYGWILGAGVGAGLYLAVVVRERLRILRPTDPQTIDPLPAHLRRAVLAYSLPVLVATLLTTSTTYVDRLILASVSTLANVGLYNYPLLFVSGALIVTGPFTTILLPRISEYMGRGDHQVIRSVTRTSITLVTLVYVPLALGIAAVGPVLLRVLVGPGFAPDALPLAVLLVLSAAAVPVIVLTVLAQGVRRTPAVMRATAVALVANVTLSVLLIPRIGILGAALGNSAMYWAPLVLLAVELRSSGFLDADARALSRIWMAALAMAATIGLPLLLFGERLLLAVPCVLLGVVILLLVLRLSRTVPQEVAEFLLDMLPRWLGFLRPVVVWVTAVGRGLGHTSYSAESAGHGK